MLCNYKHSNAVNLLVLLTFVLIIKPVTLSLPQPKGTPTVIPSQNFNPVKDAHDLRKAMKGIGTDEDGLINILCRRSNAQRQEIQKQYKVHFGRNLIQDIKRECSGNFEVLLVSLCYPTIEYYARELFYAMDGLGTTEDTINEIMCTLSNVEIENVKTKYKKMYGRVLENDFISETSGHYRALLVSFAAAGRDESGVVDSEEAQRDAKKLLQAGELRAGTDESTFNSIFSSRNYQQLQSIFQAYENIAEHSLEEGINREFSGNMRKGLLSIYNRAMGERYFLATSLYKSMARAGTNNRKLIRIIVTRSEVDLQDIKTAFEAIYDTSLKSWIKGDTSGYFRRALYVLIGEEDW